MKARVFINKMQSDISKAIGRTGGVFEVLYIPKKMCWALTFKTDDKRYIEYSNIENIVEVSEAERLELVKLFANAIKQQPIVPHQQ